MVAFAADRSDRAGDGVYCAGEFHCACTFYLFIVLSRRRRLVRYDRQ